MKINKKIIFLTVLLTISELISEEVFFLIIFLCLLKFIFKKGIPKKAIISTLPLILIVIIGISNGLIGMIAYQYSIRDILRDIIKTIAPILFISYGVCLAYKEKNQIDYIYKSILYSAIILSCRHLLLILFNLNQVITEGGTRSIGGLQSSITVLGIVILLCLNEERLNKLIPKRFNLIIFRILLILSSILYFSRTDIIVLIGILLIFIFIQKKFKFKQIASVIVKFIIFGVIIINILPKEAVNTFIDKTKRTVLEISSNENKYWDYKTINNDWRGYEVYRTKLTFKEAGVNKALFGFGFGKRLDLNMEINLGEERYSDIPILHNGYYYIRLKCGLVGVILYILFIISIFLNCIKFFKNEEFTFEVKLLLGIVLWIISSSYVVTGIYNATLSYGICILIGCIETYLTNKNITQKNYIVNNLGGGLL